MAIRKHRKCPCCGGNKGFNITVFLGGHIDIDVNFKGKVLKWERSGTDTFEHFAVCLDCGKSIKTDRLDISRA